MQCNTCGQRLRIPIDAYEKGAQSPQCFARKALFKDDEGDKCVIYKQTASLFRQHLEFINSIAFERPGEVDLTIRNIEKMQEIISTYIKDEE